MLFSNLLFFVLLSLAAASSPVLLPTRVRQDSPIGQDCNTDAQCSGFSSNQAACVSLGGEKIVRCTEENSDNPACVCYPVLMEECEDGDGGKCFKSCGDDDDDDDGCDNTNAECLEFTEGDEQSKACILTCADSSDCDEDNTRCAKFEDDNRDVGVCIDEQVVDADELETVVCVDAEALQHLSRRELVYEEHRRSKVLCDLQGSCATAGHMVRYEGTAMMMKSYCTLVGGCEEKVAWVNSPRYRVGLVVRSKTEGLVYTAFAARYETRAEEALLSTAVHVGL